MKLPVKTRNENLDSIDLKTLTAYGITESRKEIANEKLWNAALEVVKNVTDLNITEIRNIPFCDVELIILNAYKEISISPKLSMNSLCPNCHHVTELVRTKDEDRRLDLSKLTVNYDERNYEDVRIEIKPYSLEKLKSFYDEDCMPDDRKLAQWATFLKKTEDYGLRSLAFRVPTLGDMIDCSKITKTDAAFQEKLYDVCLVDAEIDWYSQDSIEDFKDIWNRFKHSEKNLLNFDFPRYSDMLLDCFRLHGINPYFDMTCDNCGSLYNQMINFLSFFVSGLLPK